jgi:hypothetical protein
MSQLPSWLQYIQALAPTVVAVIAAGIAGYIAWRQWRTANYRLSFDLHEKRFRVYEAVKVFTDYAIVQERVTRKDIDALYNGIHGAEFLFGGETRKLVNNIAQLAAPAYIARTNPASQTDKLLPEEQKLVDYLSGLDKTVEDIFRPYLDLSKAGLQSYWPS